MNTNRTGMRTVLAAAAAGALIMGSAAGAMAVPTAKKVVPDAKIQSVSIHGHKAFDVSAPRDIKLRATVRYAKGKTVPADATSAPLATVTLAAYAKKVQKAEVPALVSVGTKVLAFSSSNKKDLRYKADYTLALGAAELVSLKTAVASAALTKTKVYLCITDISVMNGVTAVTAKSNQVEKRISPDKGKAVRDCVKVVDSAPAPVAPSTTP